MNMIKCNTLCYHDKFKQFKIEMLKSLDYMEFHSYFEEEVRMFYDTVQYHMIDEIILPENIIVSSNELVNHVYFMVEGTASLDI